MPRRDEKFPPESELRSEAAALDQQLAHLDGRMAELDGRRADIARKLYGPTWKWARDVLGAGMGIVLAPPTAGLSLVLTFWVSCSLLVDGLDLSPDVAELLQARAELRAINIRKAEIFGRLDEIERLLSGPG